MERCIHHRIYGAASAEETPSYSQPVFTRLKPGAEVVHGDASFLAPPGEQDGEAESIREASEGPPLTYQRPYRKAGG